MPVDKLQEGLPDFLRKCVLLYGLNARTDARILTLFRNRTADPQFLQGVPIHAGIQCAFGAEKKDLPDAIVCDCFHTHVLHVDEGILQPGNPFEEFRQK